MPTPKDFVTQYSGKKIDFDFAYGIQCVDGFKEFCRWAGIPVKATPNNWADGYWLYRLKLGFADDFEFITGHQNYRDGDWIIWNRESASHKNSHISMYYKGFEFGENQGGDRGFCLKKTDFSDSSGALRWKKFKQEPKCKIKCGKLECTANVVNVRKGKPSLTSEIRATYKKGQTVNIDSIVSCEGYFWGHYVSYTGVSSYIALQDSKGKTYWKNV